MAKNEPKIALFYVPSQPGEGFIGIPKRDLTERDVARLSGEQLRNATSPHPNGNPPVYRTPEEKEAEENVAAMTRADLNAYAAKNGVDDPASYPNKDALIAAIHAAKNPQPPTPPAIDGQDDDGNQNGEGEDAGGDAGGDPPQGEQE